MYIPAGPAGEIKIGKNQISRVPKYYNYLTIYYLIHLHRIIKFAAGNELKYFGQKNFYIYDSASLFLSFAFNVLNRIFAATNFISKNN